MVTNQKISFTVLLLATITLMLNSIIPHHHHHEEVCFVATHCSDEEAGLHDDHHEHKGVEHNHHNSETDFCQLNGFFLAPGMKNLLGQAKYNKISSDLTLFTLAEASHIFSPLLPDDQFKILLDDQKGLKAKYLTRALRAPPIS